GVPDEGSAVGLGTPNALRLIETLAGQSSDTVKPAVARTTSTYSPGTGRETPAALQGTSALDSGVVVAPPPGSAVSSTSSAPAVAPAALAGSTSTQSGIVFND